MGVNYKSYTQMDSNKRHALETRAKQTKYMVMSNKDAIINWSTTHHAYDMGLTRLGEKCLKEGISWIK